MTDSAW